MMFVKHLEIILMISFKSIETCFVGRGFFSLIRSPLMQSEARLQLEQMPASEGYELDDDLAIEDILAFALEIISVTLSH